MKRKITVTTGTRADYGIFRPILKRIANSKNLQLKLIVTGMHLSKKFGNTINEIKNDGFTISEIIKFIPKNDTTYDMSIALGNGIVSFSKLFNKIKPDINLVLGDRDEMLASAIAAYHMNIPNAHIHGGDKSKGGIDEYNRHVITKMSNIHFAASKKSYERIIKLGENPKFVFNTGSPSIDEIKENKITTLADFNKKYNHKLTGNEILLLQHPVTTQSELSEIEILETLKAVKRLNLPTIAILPNSDPGHKKILNNLKKFSKSNKNFVIYPTLPRSDFLCILKNCQVFLGNSSSGIIEANYFKTPVISIGIRQEGRERGHNVVDVQASSKNIIEAIKNSMNKNSNVNQTKPYGTGTASIKIIRHLEKIKLDKDLIKKQIYY